VVIAALTKLRTQTKNQRHAAQLSTSVPEFFWEALQQLIAFLDAQIASLRQQAFELLISVTGIASAIQRLGEPLVLPDDIQAKQWVAMAGLDPREYQSSSSVNKKPRLSKAGNRYLRIAL